MDYEVGANRFILDDEGMNHILQRHHRTSWNGTEKDSQTFFRPGMTPDDVKDAITVVMRQNKDNLERRGMDAIFQIEGTVNGDRYVLGINRGRIGQFYPL